MRGVQLLAAISATLLVLTGYKSQSNAQPPADPQLQQVAGIVSKAFLELYGSDEHAKQKFPAELVALAKHVNRMHWELYERVGSKPYIEIAKGRLDADDAKLPLIEDAVAEIMTELYGPGWLNGPLAKPVQTDGED